MANAVIKRAETDDEVLSVAPLKRADDSECIRQVISEEVALERVIEWRERHYDVWIARSGDDTVGYAVGEKKGESYQSYGIYVAPLYRNGGIGTMLKAAQIDHARQCSCEYIWSNTSETNRPSIRVHEKHGFRFEPSGAGYIVSKRLQD